MKDKEMREETYFLGKNQPIQSHKKSLYRKVVYVVIILMLLGVTAGAYLSYKSDHYIQQTHMLKTIAVLPKGGQMPKFDGNKDISDFLKWIMLNIKYPEGLETEPARVEIRFTVKTDGTLGNFKVLKAPKEKAYEQTVIELLKKSPRWTPAKLSDGTVVNIEFTLPVAFTPEAKTTETKKQPDKSK